MPDVNALHDAIMNSSYGAAPVTVRISPIVLIIAFVFCIFLFTASVYLFKASRKPGYLTFSLLSFSAIILIPFVAFAAIRLGTPYLNPSPSVIAAHENACTAMLDAVSSGNVRWMNADWQRDVSNICGNARFAAAANSPSSRYASRM